MIHTNSLIKVADGLGFIIPKKQLKVMNLEIGDSIECYYSVPDITKLKYNFALKKKFEVKKKIISKIGASLGFYITKEEISENKFSAGDFVQVFYRKEVL
jgi:hypothetical protein